MLEKLLPRCLVRLAFWVALLVPSLSSGQDPSNLQQHLERIVNHWGEPGAAVIIVKDGEVLYEQGFGTTSVRGDRPVDTQTLASIQSVTKSFTAVALGMLVDEGAIAWDDPAQKFLPEFRFDDPYVSSHITIRDLISHRSSLPLFLGGGPFGQDSISSILTDLPEAERQMDFREGVAYSNVGMALLGEIIARVTGDTWEAFVSSRILEPLGMSASFANARELERHQGDLSAVPNLLWPVLRTDGVLSDGRWLHWNPPYCAAACIVATASDMVPFIRFLLDDGVVGGDSLVHSETLREMWTPHGVRAFPIISDFEAIIHPISGAVSYGMGFYVHEYTGRVVVEHIGSGGGSSALALLPSENVGVFVSTNADYHMAAERMVSAVKFAAIDFALGLPPTDWIAILDRDDG